MLAVGDSTEIKLRFDSKFSRGKVQKSASIISNDTIANAKQLGMSLTAEIIVNTDSTFPLVVSPPEADFGSPLGKKITVIQIKIKNVSQQQVKMRVVDSPVGLFKATFSSKRIAPSKDVDLRVRLDKNLKEDSFENSITLELNDSLKNRFTIPVRKY